MSTSELNWKVERYVPLDQMLNIETDSDTYIVIYSLYTRAYELYRTATKDALLARPRDSKIAANTLFYMCGTNDNST